MRLDELADDGFEQLGSVTLGSLVAVGDPVTFLGPLPARVMVRVKPGVWWVLGVPDPDDRDRLTEIVCVHGSALDDFYTLYDAAAPDGEVGEGSGRVVLLDAALATDAALLQSVYEPDELPWILDQGWVAEEVPGGGVRVLRPAGEPAVLLSLGFGPPPRVRAGASWDSFDGTPEG